MAYKLLFCPVFFFPMGFLWGCVFNASDVSSVNGVFTTDPGKDVDSKNVY